MTMSLRTSPVSPQSQEDMDFMDYRDDILLPPTPYNQLYAECTDILDIDEALTLKHGALSIVNESFVDESFMENEVTTAPLRSPQGIYEWLVTMKRLLLNGFVRCLWKESLQFNDDKLLSEYPNEMLMEQILRWMTVSGRYPVHFHFVTLSFDPFVHLFFVALCYCAIVIYVGEQTALMNTRAT